MGPGLNMRLEYVKACKPSIANWACKGLLFDCFKHELGFTPFHCLVTTCLEQLYGIFLLPRRYLLRVGVC